MVVDRADPPEKQLSARDLCFLELVDNASSVKFARDDCNFATPSRSICFARIGLLLISDNFWKIVCDGGMRVLLHSSRLSTTFDRSLP